MSLNDFFSPDKKLFIDLIESNGDSYWEYHPKTQELYFSEQLYKTLGYTDPPDRFDYDDWYKLVNTQDFEKAQELFSDLLNGNTEEYKAEIRVRDKNGNYIWLLDRGQVAKRDKDGKIIVVSGIHKDITKDKKAETTLSRLQNVLSVTEDGYWEWSVQENIVYFSPSWKAMLGYKDDELENSFATWEALLHPDDFERSKAKAVELASNGSTDFKVEFRLRCKDGSYKWILSRAKAVVKNSDGSPKKIAGTHVDIDRQKTMQTKIEQLNRRFQNMFQEHEAVMMLVDPDSGAIIDANTSASNFYGYTHKELCSMNISEINILSEEEIAKRREDAAKNERNYFLFEHKIKSGEIKTVEVHSSPIDTKNKKLLFSIVIDVTTKQKNEHQLKKVLNQLSQAKKIAHLGIWEFDLQTNELTWSDEVYNIFELDKNTTTPSYDTFIEDVVYPEDRKKVEDSYAKSLIDKKSYKIDHRIVTPSGKIKYVQEQCDTEFSKEGDPIRSIGTVYDTTQIQELTLKIEEERNRYKTLIDLASDEIFIMSVEDGKLLQYNEMTKKILGYSDAEMQQLSVFDWDKEFTMEEYLHILDLLDDGPITIERTHTRKDGSQYLASITAVKIKIDDQEYVYASSRNITKQKESEKELLRAKKAADRANEAKSEFLANMSHEIRTPLNGIVGLTEILLKKDLPKQQREYLNKVHISSQALMHVINDILDYSKIEAGKLDILPTEFQLETLLSTVSDLFSFQIHDKGLKFTIELDETVPNLLIGDPLRFTQVLNNFIGNAVKFTSKGFIKLMVQTLYKEDSEVALEFIVQDSGIGIAKEDQAKLFQAFEQGDTSTTRKFGGTGLGLMISKQLVELMGGEIWVESQEGVGSSFHFRVVLPYLQDEQEEDTPEQFHQFKLTQIKEALLVEDNETNQLVASLMLEDFGFNVSVANNGKEAVELCQENQYDIIFMDLQMPVMDGITAAKKIREFDSDTPIIALSAAVMPKDKQLTLDAGMKHHIAKPIDPNHLQETLSLYFNEDELNSEKVSFDLEKSDGVFIDGFDITKLQKTLHIGKQRTYSLYQNFYSNFQFDIALLDKLYANDLKKFYELVHKLKGASGNLHLNRLYQECISLEESNGSIDDVIKFQKTVTEIFEEIEQKITPLITKDTTATLDKETLKHSLEEFVEKLKKMQYINQDEIKKLLLELKHHLPSKQYHQLEKNFKEFDEESLIKLLEHILEELFDE
ncbi:MAG: PAS domain-containing protein [Sulfurimonas sp.]